MHVCIRVMHVCIHVHILILYGNVSPACLSYSNNVLQVKSIMISEHLGSWSLIFNLLEKWNTLCLPKKMSLLLLRKARMHSDLTWVYIITGAITATNRLSIISTILNLISQAVQQINMLIMLKFDKVNHETRTKYFFGAEVWKLCHRNFVTGFYSANSFWYTPTQTIS